MDNYTQCVCVCVHVCMCSVFMHSSSLPGLDTFSNGNMAFNATFHSPAKGRVRYELHLLPVEFYRNKIILDMQLITTLSPWKCFSNDKTPAGAERLYCESIRNKSTLKKQRCSSG